MEKQNYEIQAKWLNDIFLNMTKDNKPSEWLEGLTLNHEVFVRHNLKVLTLLQLKKITLKDILTIMKESK